TMFLDANFPFRKAGKGTTAGSWRSSANSEDVSAFALDEDVFVELSSAVPGLDHRLSHGRDTRTSGPYRYLVDSLDELETVIGTFRQGLEAPPPVTGALRGHPDDSRTSMKGMSMPSAATNT